MKFTIQWLPPTLNEYSRAHWSRQRKWVRVAAGYIVEQVGKPHSKESGKVRVTVQQYRRHPTDRDGATPKVILDALVRLGWARDDSEQWMETVLPAVKVDRHPRTEITIEDCGPGKLVSQ